MNSSDYTVDPPIRLTEEGGSSPPGEILQFQKILLKSILPSCLTEKEKSFKNDFFLHLTSLDWQVIWAKPSSSVYS